MTAEQQTVAQAYGDLINMEYDRDVAPLYDIEPEPPPTEEETESEG